MKLTWRAGSCALLFSLYWPAAFAAESDQTAAFSSLVSDLDALREQHNIAALGLAVVEPGATRALGLGTLAHDNLAPVTQDTLFRVGSITKVFTALGAMRLVEQGKLRLDAPVTDYLPQQWFNNPWRAQQPVTSAQLLEHTGGFQDIGKAEFDYNTPGPVPVADNLARFAADHHAAWPAGQFYSYSNLGAGLVGAAMEKVSGQRYEDFMAQQVLAPLAMFDSGFFPSQQQRERMAQGYDSDGQTELPYWHMVYRPFGGLHTSAKQMINFLQLMLGQRSSHWSQAALERIERPETGLAGQSGLHYGYGLGVYGRQAQGQLLYSHSGDADGFLSRFSYSRQLGVGYFVTITAYNGRALERASERIEQYLLAELDKLPVPETQAVSQSQLKLLPGRYHSVTQRFATAKGDSFEIVAKEGKLYSRTQSGRLRPYHKVAGEHFRRAGERMATIAILPQADGSVVYISDGGNYRKQP